MREIDPKEGKLVNALIILLPLLLIAFLYMKQSRAFPYYFAWDMDHITTIDSMLVQEGKIPSNLSHPGFGMHFMHAFTVKCARKFKLLSSSTLSDLRRSLAPLACVAEQTDFLRRHSPLLCIGILLFLWLSLEKWFRPPLAFSLLSFCVLASQESLYFQSSMIRTELYSVFYWSASVLALTYAIQTKRVGVRLLLFFMVGILFGLSFMTKMQAFFYIAFTGALFLSMAYLRANEIGISFESLSNRRKRALTVLTSIPFFVFCFLAAHSVSVAAPVGTEVFGRAGFGVTPTMVMVAAVFLFIPIIQVYLVRHQKTDTTAYTLSVYSALIMWGFLLSFALHFAMFNDVAGSWRHLGLTFKVLFLRKTFAEFPGPETLVSRLIYYLSWHPALVLSHLGLLAAIGWASLRSKLIPKKVFLACLALSALAIVNNVFSVRLSFLRDLLWAEVLYTLLTLIYLALLVQYCGWARNWIKIPAIAVMALILAFNIRHMQLTTARLNALYPLYGWSPLRHMECHFGALEAYTKFMRERLGAKPSLATLRAEGRIATHHEEIRNMASFVFPNQDITLRQIGAVEKGLPVWLNDLDYKIEAYPREFQSAIIVDSRSRMKSTGLLKPDVVTTVAETGLPSDRIMPPVSDPPLAVLPRADLRVYIFCESGGDLYKAVSSYDYPKAEELPRIVLSKGDEKLVMYGRLIPAYETIPYHTLAGRYFFVIFAPFYL